MVWLIGFKLYTHSPFTPFRFIKLAFGVKVRSDEIVECRGYESRTGLHWDRCYYIDNGEVREYVGLVKKLYTVLSFRPMISCSKSISAALIR